MSGNVVDLFEVSDDVSSDVKSLIEQRKQEIIDGTFVIFEGSSDGDLLGMSYFVDNVVGTLD
jgi:basic membrane lipoprotein Med (substrate-binding protein (PBP1-ABC) superfamily)